MARGTGTSRNRTRNGIRTRFLDQVSIAPFRPAELLTIEIANYLALNNTFMRTPLLKRVMVAL